MNRNIKIALRIMTTVIVGVVLLFALSVSAVRLFGFEVYGVLTGSMEPKYPTGSLIYVKEIDTSSLEVGDVISFKLSSSVIATHRIVELVADESNPNIVKYRTKGDANDAVDSSLVSREDIIGKVVFCIPQMGYFMDYIQSPTGVFMTVLVSVGLVLIVFVAEIITGDDKMMVRIRARIIGQDPERMPPRYDYRDMPYRGYDEHRQEPRGRSQQYYGCDQRTRRGRYEDDYRAMHRREDYEKRQVPRQHMPQRRYEEVKNRAPQYRYESDRRGSRTGYDMERRVQRSPYAGNGRIQTTRPAPRQEQRSSRSRSSQYDDGGYRGRNAQPLQRNSSRSTDRYSDYR